MIHLRKYFDSNGDEVDADGNPIVRDMARDGDVVSVPLIWMDNKTARDPREVAWLKMCDYLSHAWKQKGDPLPPVADAMAVKLPAATSKPTPWADPLLPPRAPASEDPLSEMSASRLAYLRYKKRISTMYAGRR